jgi:hypothetical protein
VGISPINRSETTIRYRGGRDASLSPSAGFQSREFCRARVVPFACAIQWLEVPATPQVRVSLIDHDASKPGKNVGPTLELSEMLQRVKMRLLEHILDIAGVL